MEQVRAEGVPRDGGAQGAALFPIISHWSMRNHQQLTCVLRRRCEILQDSTGDKVQQRIGLKQSGYPDAWPGVPLACGPMLGSCRAVRCSLEVGSQEP